MAQKQIDLEARLGGIARWLKSQLPKDIGFTVLLFHYGDPADGVARYLAYLSSGERSDMIKTMKEAIARFEGGMGARDIES